MDIDGDSFYMHEYWIQKNDFLASVSEKSSQKLFFEKNVCYVKCSVI